MTTMQYWLVKSDPEDYGWDDLVKEGRTAWTGVRNYAARLHLNGMKKGDRVLFYHSNQDTAVMGIASVSREAYPDPTSKEDRWVAVDLEPVSALSTPVTLARIKAEKKLRQTGLVRIGRLSVMPFGKEEFNMILNMGS